MDQRSYREAEAISATGDPVLRYVSGRVSPEWMLPKALWLKRHEPEVYGRAFRIVECTDWMMYRLTGRWTLSRNHVAVKWNYARPDGGWPLALLAAVGLGDLPGKWPEEIVALGLGGATLARDAAEDLGLRPGTPVAQGGIDAYLGMLGMGATSDGDVAVIVGSSTCHLAQSRTGVFGSGAAGCYPDATVEGLYTLEAGQTATGSILDWYRRHFAAREQAEADRLGVNVYQILDAQAAATPPGADGLIVRDDWQGNRSPYKNPQARGVIAGLSLSHGPGHVFRALYEATACGTRHILEDASSHGLRVSRIFLGGGGAKSPLWLKIHADILKRPIHLPREVESCALGAAMAGALAAGIYPDFNAAAAEMVEIERIVEPDPSHAAVYDDLFARYVALYEDLNPASDRPES
jgi:ribulokinase